MKKPEILPAALLAAALAAAAAADAAPKTFAKGADLSWATAFEKRGYSWQDHTGRTRECFALMKSLGFDSVRLRVWVDPKNGENAGEDLAEKARRAAKLHMPVMVDFHYSDTWADPGKQYKPAKWAGYDARRLAAAVHAHTERVLKQILTTGAEVAWVQIGNEVRPGLLWDPDPAKSGALRDIAKDGKTVAAKNTANFAAFLNAGAKAARKTCPKAKIIVHCDHGDRWGDIAGVLNAARGVDYDIFGVSLYPPKDWGPSIAACCENMARVKKEYGKDAMVCEFGMPTHPFDPARDATAAMLRAAKKVKSCRGVFYWEPESFPEHGGYTMGASTAEGKTVRPTPALSAFKR